MTRTSSQAGALFSQLKQQTAGPSWFDLPAPSEADLPRMYREVEALRLRNQLDPKRFYKKDEGEGKGIKGLPKHFAVGFGLVAKCPFSDSNTVADWYNNTVNHTIWNSQR
jgi:hypothetical protein